MKLIFYHIRFLFLWIALAAILAHGIIPHHHHMGMEEQHRTCKISPKAEINCCNHEHDDLLAFYCETSDNKNCNECHFKTDLTTHHVKISLDQTTHKNYELYILYNQIDEDNFIVLNESTPQELLFYHSTSRGPPTKC